MTVRSPFRHLKIWSLLLAPAERIARVPAVPRTTMQVALSNSPMERLVTHAGSLANLALIAPSTCRFRPASPRSPIYCLSQQRMSHILHAHGPSSSTHMIPGSCRRLLKVTRKLRSPWALSSSSRSNAAMGDVNVLPGNASASKIAVDAVFGAPAMAMAIHIWVMATPLKTSQLVAMGSRRLLLARRPNPTASLLAQPSMPRHVPHPLLFSRLTASLLPSIRWRRQQPPTVRSRVARLLSHQRREPQHRPFAVLPPLRKVRKMPKLVQVDAERPSHRMEVACHVRLPLASLRPRLSHYIRPHIILDPSCPSHRQLDLVSSLPLAVRVRYLVETLHRTTARLAHLRCPHGQAVQSYRLPDPNLSQRMLPCRRPHWQFRLFHLRQRMTCRLAGMTTRH